MTLPIQFQFASICIELYCFVFKYIIKEKFVMGFEVTITFANYTIFDKHFKYMFSSLILMTIFKIFNIITYFENVETQILTELFAYLYRLISGIFEVYSSLQYISCIYAIARGIK